MLGNGATTTVATALVLVPGLVTTVLGVLLLLPPVRAAVGPAVTGFALRGLQRHAPLVLGYGATWPTSTVPAMAVTTSTARSSTSKTMSIVCPRRCA